MSVMQVQDLAGAMTERCRAMVITQAASVCESPSYRPSAYKMSTSSDGRCGVEFQTTPDGKYRVSPKTPRSRRALPLPEVVGKAHAAHIAEFPPTEDGSLLTAANGNLYRHSITPRGSLLQL